MDNVVAIADHQCQRNRTEESNEPNRDELATLVDVFRTLLELDRKYGGDMEKEKQNGSNHRQSG